MIIPDFDIVPPQLFETGNGAHSVVQVRRSAFGAVVKPHFVLGFKAYRQQSGNPGGHAKKVGRIALQLSVNVLVCGLEAVHDGI
jgi:hypothetical protein